MREVDILPQCVVVSLTGGNTVESFQEKDHDAKIPSKAFLLKPNEFLDSCFIRKTFNEIFLGTPPNPST